MVIESPSDLNRAIISFFILSMFGPLAWCINGKRHHYKAQCFFVPISGASLPNK